MSSDDSDFGDDDHTSPNVPRWLAHFVRDEVRPLLVRQRDAALRGLARWLAHHDEQLEQHHAWQRRQDEALRQLALRPADQRQVRKQPPGEGFTWCERWRDPVDGRVSVIRAWLPPELSEEARPPLDSPLPPPSNRDVSSDECWAALLTVHDLARDPRERFVPADYFTVAESSHNDEKKRAWRWGHSWDHLCRHHAGQLTEAHLPDLRAMLRTIASGLTSPVPPVDENNGSRPDGLEGGRWLWWRNEKHDVSKGVVYRLLAYMWNRDSARYDDLEDAKVFDSAVAPQTIRSYANKANKALPSGFPWRLSTDSSSRCLTKIPTIKGV